MVMAVSDHERIGPRGRRGRQEPVEQWTFEYLAARLDRLRNVREMCTDFGFDFRARHIEPCDRSRPAFVATREDMNKRRLLDRP
jgi:hypothetical protein